MRAVEGIDITAALSGARPAGGLHGAGHLQGHLVEAALPQILSNASLAHQAEQIAVGADVVEPVIVNAGVAEVRRHHVDGALAADLQEFRLARGIELEDGGPELKALGPLGPAAAGVLAAEREDRRAGGWPPAFLKRPDVGNV